MWRGLLAGGFRIALSLCIGAQFPSGVRVLLAGGLGFLAYGFVMILFVIGLRHLGAGRAGAYFATAPFVGAAISICLGEKISLALVAAAVLMAGGVCTLLGERHGAGVARTTS
jgi:drug/metabolite transporter (DMT)-like permease